MGERSTLDVALFPLNAVLFPGGQLPLRVFETRYVDMTRECMRETRPFGICLIRKGQETGRPAMPEDIGCLAEITRWDMVEQGVLALGVSGGLRFRIVEREVDNAGLARAAVLPIAAEADTPVPQRFIGCANLLRLIAADADKVTLPPPLRFDDAAWVGYRLCELLPIPLAAKQKLLELNDPLVRLEILHRFLEQRGLIAGR